LIVPHAQRALLINRAIEREQSVAATLADALDGLRAGIFLLDSGCRIVHANSEGHDMLAADDVLRSMGGQFTTRNAEVNQALRNLFAAPGDIALTAKGAAWPLIAHDGSRYVAHVLPLSSVVRTDKAACGKAVAALFVRKAELDSQSGSELIARTFELTPAEMRVLLAIVDVGGVPETADMLGIADSTVKTHLHRVFAKTGTSRQADLVKLVAGYSNPLAN
jgi:DNA-binding CsgD family transcriptional regulator